MQRKRQANTLQQQGSTQHVLLLKLTGLNEIMLIIIIETKRLYLQLFELTIVESIE